VQEIEKLNAECLEFEETVVSLRKEIADAWGSYKVAQEKAAVREEELLDEIQEITKAKATDKQQMQLQLAKASEEVTESLKLLKVAQADKDIALAQLQEYQQEAETWKAREESLLTELAQARAGSVLGAQDLLESLANAEKSMHQMRSEHSSLLRQSQVRQHELERNIAEISNSLMEKDKELMRFQMQLQQAGRDEASQRDLESLRSQVSTLLNQLDEKSDKHTTLERRTKALESELRANLLSFQDERERAKEIMSSLEAKIVTLEDNLKEATKKKTVRPVPIGLRTPGQQSEVSDAGSTGDWEVVGEDPNALAKALDQIQQLTGQLLRKQGLAQELQAEKAALKSRVIDLQTRCSRAEQQLNSMMDAEADDYGDDSDDAGRGGGKLMRRGSKGKAEHKVINDLEKLGVRTAPSVAKAVNFIDTWTLVTGRYVRAALMGSCCCDDDEMCVM
jgi:chromosome segregation ATPase